MLRVADVMTRNVYTARRETPLKEIAQTLTSRRVGGVPVLDERRCPVGVITKADILFARPVSVSSGHWRRFVHHGAQQLSSPGVKGRTAAEAMSSPVITTGPQARVSTAALLMDKEGVNRLPVVLGKELVGIICRHDLVRVFTRDDHELGHEIRSTTLAGLRWPDALDLKIEEGRVSMSGHVDSLDDARTLPAEVRNVLGVVSVDAELTAWDAFTDGPVVVARHL